MCRPPMVIVLAMLCRCLVLWTEPAAAEPVPAASGPASGASAPAPVSAKTIGPFEQGLAAYDQGRFDLAYSLWLPLAQQGRVAAQFNVANLLEQGKGVAQNPAEAGQWYSKAAEQGDLASVLKVAAMYESGTGLPADPAKARFWYRLAAANTGTDAASVAAAKLARSRLKDLPGDESPPEKTFPFDGGRYVVFAANRRECLVALQGTITRAASFMFDTAMEEATKARCEGTITLLLESPGGGSQEGLVLGRQVRHNKLRTVARYECASACAAIFLGGTERVLWGARAAIGFHQVRIVRGDQKLEEGNCLVSAQSEESIQMRRYLHFVVPEHADDLFRVFMSTSCNSIKWFNGQAALEMGVATKLEAEGVDVFGAKELR